MAHSSQDLGHILEVRIDSVVNVKDIPSSPTYTSYIISVNFDAQEWQIKRRFSDFHQLNAHMVGYGIRLPFPKKTWTKNLKPDFVESRRVALQGYLRALLQCSTACEAPEFAQFLGFTDVASVLHARLAIEQQGHSKSQDHCRSPRAQSRDPLDSLPGLRPEGPVRPKLETSGDILPRRRTKETFEDWSSDGCEDGPDLLPSTPLHYESSDGGEAPVPVDEVRAHLRALGTDRSSRHPNSQALKNDITPLCSTRPLRSRSFRETNTDDERVRLAFTFWRGHLATSNSNIYRRSMRIWNKDSVSKYDGDDDDDDDESDYHDCVESVPVPIAGEGSTSASDYEASTSPLIFTTPPQSPSTTPRKRESDNDHLMLSDVLCDDYRETELWQELLSPEPPKIQFDNGKVRCATLCRLVEYATSENEYDIEFTRAFLTSFRSFSTPSYLLRLLIQRYHVPPDLDPSELSRNKHSHPEKSMSDPSTPQHVSSPRLDHPSLGLAPTAPLDISNGLAIGQDHEAIADPTPATADEHSLSLSPPPALTLATTPVPDGPPGPRRRRLTAHEMPTYVSSKALQLLGAYPTKAKDDIEISVKKRPSSEGAVSSVPMTADTFRHSIQLRVIVFLRQWLEACYTKDFLRSGMLRRLLDVFLRRIEEDGHDTRLIAACLKSHRKPTLGGQKHNLLATGTTLFLEKPPEPLVSAAALSAGALDLFTIRSEEIARQLTIIDFKLYSTLEPFDFLEQHPGGGKLSAASANKKSSEAYKGESLKQLINHFNKVASAVAVSVVTPVSTADRATAMKKWIKIAHCLLKLNNFNTCMAVIAGLNNSSVFRLKRTRRRLDRLTDSKLRQVMGVLSPGGAYKRYREELRRRPPPSIPYVGVCLTDLVFIADGNPNMIGDQINFVKRSMQVDAIRKVLDFQKFHYNLIPVDKIIQLLSCHLKLVDDDELYALSLERERRE
eukprot:Rmarinus@m.15765